jgi:hypothetical protein
MPGEGGEHEAFAIAPVEGHGHGFDFPDFTQDHRFAGPGIHQAARQIASRLDLDVINASRIPGGDHQETASRLEIAEGDFVRWSDRREQIDTTASAVEQGFGIATAPLVA